MRPKTIWTIFGVLVGLFIIIFGANAMLSGGTATKEEAPPAGETQDAMPPLPDDISNPGEVQDKDVSLDSFPETVGGMTRTEVFTGQEAVDQIGQLHGGAFKPTDAFVASYKGDGGASAQIWVSVAASEDEAKAQLQDMHNKIGDSSAFTNHQVLYLDPILYHYVEGMGQEHFFYYRGNDVIWISVSDHQMLPLFTGII